VSAWRPRWRSTTRGPGAAVEKHHGVIVKTTGDGLFAAFADPLDAVNATVMFQQSLVDPAVTNGIAIRVRCGLHAGVVERRDNDIFGTPVNRTARIMSVAHGGQILVSQAVVDEIGTRLSAPTALRDLGSVRLKDTVVPGARLSGAPSRPAAGTSRRCARSRPRRTTCPSSLPRSSGASASSRKPPSS